MFLESKKNEKEGNYRKKRRGESEGGDASWWWRMQLETCNELGVCVREEERVKVALRRRWWLN